MKPLPLMVKVNAGLRATTEFGMTLVMTGTGLLRLTVSALEVPPPPLVEAGLKTKTLAVPGFAMSVAGICAINCVAETTVVGRSLPFQRATDVLIKFVPVSINAKPAPPALTEFGLMLVSIGAGAGASVIVT